jgi:small subunit ribosomal protein S18e
MYALTKIKGVGKRYSNLVCKKADVDLGKRYAYPYHTPSFDLEVLT